MVSALISRVLLLTAGTLYPAYRSYKGIKTKNVREYVKWMMYWIVFAVYLCLEALADIFVSFWCPLYYELKILFIIWLLSPYTKGASLVYRKFLHPFLLKHEQEIDVCLEKFKTESYTKMMDLGNRGLTFAKEAVAVAALRSHEHIIGQVRKTVSLNDVTDSRPRSRNALQHAAAGDDLDEEMGEEGDRPVSPPVNNRRRVKPARARPGLGHVVKRTLKAESAVEQGIEYSDDASNLPDEESAYVIDQEFSYLEEQEEMGSNEQLDEALDEGDEVLEAPIDGQSPHILRRKGSTQDDGTVRLHGGQRRPKTGKEAMYATLPRRSTRKGTKKD